MAWSPAGSTLGQRDKHLGSQTCPAGLRPPFWFWLSQSAVPTYQLLPANSPLFPEG
ncbi:hypothetical protein PO183_13055 [Bacteroides ovatus]|uniref:hypothetical protein n=1 Tax=Bacteroides ovatus TaxID=28116 RepID=UPI0020A79805|nr:hypothetical protein [Bacteroides ovatus]MDC2367075.1 hypothetical protein [Bacteroides ovatus]